MTFATTYSYSDRRIFDLKTLVDAIRFVVINSVLAFIFLFLIVEEFEWAIFSNRKEIKDKVIDQTSWNIKTLI
ncbi:hypothetical protein [Prochlorococcus marinus]|uniref:hypothetical protein n=1 Tax=Prochlorococcus marinus TaxID=1219 RepID=UPI0039B0040A